MEFALGRFGMKQVFEMIRIADWMDHIEERTRAAARRLDGGC